MPHPTPQLSAEFLLDVGRGRIPGYEVLSKFGRDLSVASGVWSLISSVGMANATLTAPTLVRIKAGDVADGVGGAGARTIFITGLDENLNRVEEILTTAGISAGADSVNSYWRVDRAFVLTCGAYATPYNTADVVIENAAGTQDILSIVAEEGQTQHCMYSVASGITAYFLFLHYSADGVKAADFRVLTRENLNVTAAPVSARRLRHYSDGLLGIDDYSSRSAKFALLGPADIWVEAEGSGAITEVSASFDLLLVTD